MTRNGWFSVMGLAAGMAMLVFPKGATGQSHEVQQLLLNWAKLAQIRSTLEDMQEGYRLLRKGYNALRDVAEGNFSLHAVFLSGLLEVSPAVKNYQRIGQILRIQQAIVSESKRSLARFRASGRFRAEELDYLAGVYENLFTESVKNLDALLLVVTASTLRMSDGERLGAIDRIFLRAREQLEFLRRFTGEANMLQLLRRRKEQEVDHLKNLYE